MCATLCFGFTGTAASAKTVQPSGSKESMVANLTQGTQSMEAVNTESGEEDARLAAFSQKLKTKEPKNVDPLQFSHESGPNPIPPSSRDEVRRVFTEEKPKRIRGLKILLLKLKFRWKIKFYFTA